MSLLWMDGFDHYGVDETELTDGPWSEVVTAAWSLQTVNPRTGTHHMRHAGPTASPMRRQFGAAKLSAAIGYAIFVSNLPTVNNRLILAEFRDAANAAQVCVCLQTTGAIQVLRGGQAGTVLATSSVLMVAGAYNHFECATTINNATGSVEVRLNGVTIVSVTGADTQATALTETSQVAIGTVTGATGCTTDVEDFFAWDTAGSQNNSFIGDQKVYTIFADSDPTEEKDWTPNTGVQCFAMVDEANSDEDTTYVETLAIAESGQNVLELGLGDIASEVSAISAVYTAAKLRKTDAGTCDVMQSMRSVNAVDDGTPVPITTAYTYYSEMFELDPNTAAPWTPSAFNASVYRITRTA